MTDDYGSTGINEVGSDETQSEKGNSSARLTADRGKSADRRSASKKESGGTRQKQRDSGNGQRRRIDIGRVRRDNSGGRPVAASKPSLNDDFSDVPWRDRPNGGRVQLVPVPSPPLRAGDLQVPCKPVAPLDGGGQRDKDRWPVLCDARDDPVDWSDVLSMCREHSVGSRPGSVLVTTALRWTSLRVHAFGAAQTPDSTGSGRNLQSAGTASGSESVSSTFPVDTTALPWDVLRSMRGPGAPGTLLSHRMLTTPVFLFDARFDVLLDATTLCAAVAPAAAAAANAGALPAGTSAGAPSGPAQPRDAARALALVGDLVRGVAAKGSLRASSSFWNSAWATGLALSPSSVANTSFCDPSASPSGKSGGDRGRAHTVCERHWLAPSRLRHGMKALLNRLYTRPLDVSLYNTGSMLRHLRGLGDARFRYTGSIFQGAKQGNTSLLNAGFNPPGQHIHAGTMATFYNVVVTTAGALQSLPGTAGAGGKDGKRKDGEGGGHHTLHFHTTCERTEDARVSQSEVGALPIHDEVIVLTHRIEANIYHWTAETLGKLAPVIDYLLANPRVKIHVLKLDSEPPFRAAHLRLLGIDWESRVVTGNVRARIVHYPDNHGCRFPYGHWVMLLRERYRAALGMETPLRADDDEATSDVIVTEAAGEGDNSGASSSGRDGKRRGAKRGRGKSGTSATLTAPSSPSASSLAGKHVVVLRRRSARRIANEVDFLQQLRSLKSEVPFTLTEIADWRMPDQAAVFAAFATADVVVGAHGAGQTNNIVAKPGSCLVEVMPTKWLVPCYWRMAGHLGLRYSMFMVRGDRTPPITIAVRSVVQAVRACLEKGDEDDGGGGGNLTALAR